MKYKTHLPRFTAITLGLMFTAAVIVFSTMSCAPKSACGNKHQHKARAKKIKRMAPGMGG